MHVLIKGVRYDFDALNKASLLDLIALKKETGLTMQTLSNIYEALEKRSKEPDYDFLGDEDNLLLMAVLLWLARRKAGERTLSFEESADAPLSEIEFVADPDDEPEADEPAETVDPS